MQPDSKKYFTQWMYDVWRNKFLFWAVMAGEPPVFIFLDTLLTICRFHHHLPNPVHPEAQHRSVQASRNQLGKSYNCNGIAHC